MASENVSETFKLSTLDTDEIILIASSLSEFLMDKLDMSKFDSITFIPPWSILSFKLGLVRFSNSVNLIL